MHSELGAWQRMDESRLGYFKRMYVWDACSDASISFESADASMVQYLAASVENDRVMQALFDALDHSLRPTPNGTNSGAVNQTPLQLDRAYGVQIAKYVFPWTRFAESGQPFDDSGALPPVELELSDGRKLTTSLLVRLCLPSSSSSSSDSLLLSSSARSDLLRRSALTATTRP